MTDSQNIALRIVGAVDWQTDVSGFCRCPGEALHTHPTGKKDCRINVDGVPTIYCFHASCAAAVAEANRRLRQELNSGGANALASRPTSMFDVGCSMFGVSPTAPPGAAHHDDERRILASLRARAERFKPVMFETFRWPLAQIIADSPRLVAERDAEDQFRAWLRLWPAHSHVWIGDVFSSGRPEHRTHFRPVADWYQIGPVMGNFTCGSAFQPGSFRRSNENCAGTRFLIVESDTLTKDEVGAVFAYLNRRLHFRLHAIVDTAGKSLHGWFDAPRDARLAARLKVLLTVFGCDPKMFTYSQPVRVPGAWRDGRLQRLVWLRE